jgi:O-antigen/teichoic acid export membrane protein
VGHRSTAARSDAPTVDPLPDIADPEQQGTVGVVGLGTVPDPQSSSSAAMAGLFGRDSIYMIMWVLQLVGAAVVTPFVTRLVAPNQFGVISSANALMQVIFACASCGMGVAIQRRYVGADGPLMAARLLTLSFGVVATVSAAAFGSSVLWIGALGLETEKSTALLSVAWAGVSAITASLLAYLRSQDRLGPFGAVSLLQSVVAEALSLVLVATLADTALAFVAGQVAAQVLATVLGLVYVRPRLLRRRDRALALSTLAFAVPLLPATLGTFVLNAADRLMLQSFLDAEAVARYQIAYNIGSLPMLVLGALHSAWLPRFFQVADGEQREAVLAQSSAALFRLLPPVMLGLTLGSPVLLRLWAPASFKPEDLVSVTAVIIVTATAYTGQLAASRSLLARGKSRLIAVSTVCAALANIGLNLVLIPQGGPMGAAVATAVSYGLLWLTLLVPTCRGGGTIHARELSVCAVVAVITLLIAATPLALPLLARMGAIALCLAWFGLLLRAITDSAHKTPVGARHRAPRGRRERRP